MENRSPRVMITEPKSIDLGNGIYGILTPPVGFHEYLVLGEEKALLIDTGKGVGSLRKLIDTLTNLPVILVNTHCHPDLLDRKLTCAKQLLDGAEGERMERGGNVTYMYEAEGTAIEYIPEKVCR